LPRQVAGQVFLCQASAEESILVDSTHHAETTRQGATVSSC